MICGKGEVRDVRRTGAGRAGAVTHVSAGFQMWGDVIEGKKPSPLAAERCWFFSSMYFHHSAAAVSSGGSGLGSKGSSLTSK